MRTTRRYGLVFLFIALSLALASSIAQAKFMPYIEAIDADWGDLDAPWPAPDATIFKGLYGRLGTYGDVDAIALRFSEPVKNWMLEAIVPVCGEHFKPFSPSIALIGPGFDAPEAGSLPFELPKGAGALLLTENAPGDLDDVTAYFPGKAQQHLFQSVNIPQAGEYYLAVWEASGHTGAYVLATGSTHPGQISEREAAEMGKAIDFINSGDWMGQDCNAPLATEDCPQPDMGRNVSGEFDQTFPERSVVGEGYVLTGVVRDASTCLPIAGAKIWFWMANGEGALFSNGQGAYRIQSDLPGGYGPESHIHLFVSAPGYRSFETEFLLKDGIDDHSGEFHLALLPE